MDRGDFGQAEASFRIAAEQAPGEFQTHFLLAVALSAQAKSDDSLISLSRAIELNPALAMGYVLRASLYQRQGKFDEAIAASQMALEIDPRLSKPVSDIIHCKKLSESDTALLGHAERLLAEPRRSAGERIGLHYALGKGYDDLRQFERALEHFDAANAIAWETVGARLGYSPSDESLAVDRIIQCFSVEFLDKHRNTASNSELPLLIVGMIRSGTTLLDTILSRHRDIASAGELTFWEDESAPLLRSAFRGAFDRVRLTDVADSYRRKLREVGIKRKRVIDKMPLNYLHLGLIHLAFPSARIIHARRNPVDTCLSIYTTEFGIEPPRFAFSRKNIVHAYREYLRLMEHWRRVIPADRLFEVDYEDVVLNRERVLPALIEFGGLEWDSGLLDQEDRGGEIVTPSRWQARQPVYKTSLERRRNYEPWLREFAALQDRLI